MGEAHIIFQACLNFYEGNLRRNKIFETIKMRSLLIVLVFVLATMAKVVSGRQRNVHGDPLALCSSDPMTGWYRDGYCNTDFRDGGAHVVCGEITAEFLAFTQGRGNDLTTPVPPSFPGLNPGDFWCLCASRWREAAEAGVGPRVNLAATNEGALEREGVSLNLLESHSLDRDRGLRRNGQSHQNCRVRFATDSCEKTDSKASKKTDSKKKDSKKK